MASSTDTQQPASVRMTDKKCACGYSQHCNCSTKPFISYVDKDASCKVPFPRSNSKRISNAQFPMGVKELNFPSGKTADGFTKARNSTRWILRQNRIEMNQSASRVSSQSATPLIDQSEPRVSAITVQSEATRVGSDPYKSCRICSTLLLSQRQRTHLQRFLQLLHRRRTLLLQPALFRATSQHYPVRHRG